MNQRLASTLVFAALCAASAVSVPAHAAFLQFDADLRSSNEIPPVSAPAAGAAMLFYDTMDTASLADDTYNFRLRTEALRGAPSGFHIHGAATTTENAPVLVDLSTGPFNSNASFDAATQRGRLVVHGDKIPVPNVPETLSTSLRSPGPGSNAGHPAMSFLELLQSGLAYVNVHTSLNPGGETRGQLRLIPEPETYGMLLAGLGLLGVIARRRRRALPTA
jgi:hypothetical protein